MTLSIRAAVLGSLLVVSGLFVRAQEWTTSGVDAQRTSWIRSDDRLMKDAVTKGEFKFLWKLKADNQTRQLNALTAPVILDRLIGYRGFKALAFVGGSSDRVFSFDTDLARPYWTANLNYSAATGGQAPSSLECPGGLTAMPARRTALAPVGPGRGAGGGRGRGQGSAVGEPGQGAAVLAEMAARGRGAAPAAGRGAPPAAGPGAAGRGAAGPPATAPPQGGGGRGRGAGGGVAPVPFGGVDPVYAVGSDGFLHVLRSSNGSDAAPAVPFLPAGSRSSALTFVDGIVYATTSNECGAVPNAVWAIDLTTPEQKVSSWRTGGPNVAGADGPAFGLDGTLFVATGSEPAQTAPSSGGRQSYANSVIALDRGTLTPKDWFTAPGVAFNESPIVVRFKNRDLVAATANDGRLYLLDGTSLGGVDHKTPLFVTAKYTGSGVGAGLATWEDQTTRWIAAPVAGTVPAAMTFAPNGLSPNGSIVTFKVSDADGKVTLQPAWASRNVTSPLTPIVVNGLIIAAASGEYRGAGAGLTAAQRAQRSTPATLYILDGTTGKELWTSGATITSFARGGLSAGSGQVYVVTYDNTLYTFGIPMEH